MRFSLILFFLFLFAAIGFGQSDVEKGIEFYDKGGYKAAIENLQNAVKTDEKNRNAWLYLEMSLAKTDKTGEARKALRKGDSLAKNASDYDNDVKIILKPRPRYPEEAKQNLTSGVVKIVVEFGADGNLKHIFAFQVLPDRLTAVSLEAVKNIKFEPAHKNGKPVNSIGVVEYTFDIR